MPIEPIDQYLIEEYHFKPLKPVMMEPVGDGTYNIVIEDMVSATIYIEDYVKWLEKQWKEHNNR